MRPTLVLLAAAVLAVPVQSQVRKSKPAYTVSCPAADSIFAGPPHKPSVKLATIYDPLSDSVSVTDDYIWTDIGTGTFSDNSISFHLWLGGLGKTLTASSAGRFELLARRTSEHHQQISPDFRLLPDSALLILVLDDTLRLMLRDSSGADITTRTVALGLGRPTVDQRFIYLLTDDQLRALARAQRGIAGIGKYRTKLEGSLLYLAEQLLRARACSDLGKPGEPRQP